MINLDPSLINQDSVRKKRRKKMLLIAIAPVIILSAAGLFFLRPGVFDIIFGANYDSKNSNTLIALSQFHKTGNIIEPYIAYYDAGTAYIMSGEGEKAEVELRESMKNLPPADKICQVVVNLSYSIEIQADAAKNRQKYDEALVLYSRAEGVLYENSCASKNAQQSRDKKAGAAMSRISRKRGATVSEMNNNGDPSEIDPDKGGLEISEEQLRAMQDNTMNGNNVRSTVLERLRGSGSGSGGSSLYNSGHW